MFAYVVSGLTVSSDLALPGLIPAIACNGTGDRHATGHAGDRDATGHAVDVGSGETPDVTIRAGSVPVDLDDVVARGPNWQLAAGRFLVSVPGVIRMMLSDGDTIRYAPDRGVAVEDAAVFVSGTGFGLLLHQRGRIVLHASAVRCAGGSGEGDAAMLFCGASGAGKSTLAAALVAAGHDLVADDFCGISLTAAGVPMVHPDGRQLKLWENAIDRLALAARRSGPVRTQLRKYYVEPQAATAVALPIRALYILREARPPHQAGIVEANLVDGALMIQRNAYRPAMIARMGQAALYFHAATAIARHAGVFTLTRDMDFAQLPANVAALEAHWHTLSSARPPASILPAAIPVAAIPAALRAGDAA